MKQSVVYIGIDVAKAHLDVAWTGTFRRLPNERSGHAALVRWIKQSATPVQLICEASLSGFVSPSRAATPNVLKLARCPHSLIASLATLPSMSLIPFAPFGAGGATGELLNLLHRWKETGRGIRRISDGHPALAAASAEYA